MKWPGYQLGQHHCVKYGFFAQVVVKHSLSDAGPAHQGVRVLLKLLIQENESADEAEGEHGHQLCVEQQLVPGTLARQVVDGLQEAGCALDTNGQVLQLRF